MDPKLEIPLYRRLWSERRVRTGLKATGLAALCFSLIYLTTSDRVRVDERAHTRIEVSGKSDNKGGLMINGRYVPLNNAVEGELRLSLDDFVNGATNAYNAQFTKNSTHPVERVLFTFRRGSGTYAQELDYRTAVGSETKELTFAGMDLQDIKIEYADGRQYIVNFPKHEPKRK